MAVPYAPSNQPGNKYSVPDYAEAADGPAAFKAFADQFLYLLPPIGSLQPYIGDSSPQGWLLCDGSEYDQATYPRLSTLCGTKFGTASAGKFKVPDLRGRVIAGVNSGDSDFSTVGKVGGAKSVTITTSNLPEHDHAATGTVTVNSGNATHTHTGTTTANNHRHKTGYRTVARQSGSGGTNVPINEGTDDDFTDFDQHAHLFSTDSSDAPHTHTATTSITIANGGGVAAPTALPIVQPFVSLNYIIRADI